MDAKKQNKLTLEKLTAFAKTRGFIYPSSEIYGGLANTYDFGPYGTALKENIRNLWWKIFIQRRGDIYGIDSSIIINPKIWEASGHVANFGDVMVEDRVTRKRYRADHIIEDFFAKKGEEVKVDGKTAEELQQIIEENGIKSPDGNEMTPARKFNLLFKTEIGIIEGAGAQTYLRGEIAQGLFVNFKNIIESMHPKLPFGIGQAGKAFRNEITKGQLTHRTLEFDLMEFEYFFDPETQDWNELYEYWKAEMEKFVEALGIKRENIRWRRHEEFELSHYSKRTEDIEYNYPWGFKEMFGLAYRTDFDLSNHEKHSGKELKYIYPDGKRVTPHVIEPTFGLSRLVTIMLIDAYEEEEVKASSGETETRIVLRLNNELAPVKVAVLPLMKKNGLAEKAKEIYDSIKRDFVCEYDESGSIGKRYRRQDEIGTPYCVTIDFDTLEKGTVTVRDRDSMKQEIIKVGDLMNWLRSKFSA
jgi:glycyl-tRNA synthetase